MSLSLSHLYRFPFWENNPKCRQMRKIQTIQSTRQNSSKLLWKEGPNGANQGRRYLRSWVATWPGVTSIPFRTLESKSQRHTVAISNQKQLQPLSSECELHTRMRDTKRQCSWSEHHLCFWQLFNKRIESHVTKNWDRSCFKDDQFQEYKKMSRTRRKRHWHAKPTSNFKTNKNNQINFLGIRVQILEGEGFRNEHTERIPDHFCTFRNQGWDLTSYLINQALLLQKNGNKSRGKIFAGTRNKINLKTHWLKQNKIFCKFATSLKKKRNMKETLRNKVVFCKTNAMESHINWGTHKTHGECS